jgi:hypothetical protein
VFAAPSPFAQPLIDCNIDPLVLAISFNLSSNFSQILGTAKNNVGFPHYKVYTNVPYKASGLA